MSELILLLCGLSLTTTHHGWTGPLRSEGPGPGQVSGCSYVAPMALASSEGGPCVILVPPWPRGGAAELPGPGCAQQLARMSWHCSPCTIPGSRGHPPTPPPPFPSDLYSSHAIIIYSAARSSPQPLDLGLHSPAISAREVQSSIRVSRKSWGLLLSHCRAKETSSITQAF